METLKPIVLAVILGWIPWTVISLIISWVFNMEFEKIYVTVGVPYGILLIGLFYKVGR